MYKWVRLHWNSRQIRKAHMSVGEMGRKTQGNLRREIKIQNPKSLLFMKLAKGRVLFRVNIFLTHSVGALLTSPPPVSLKLNSPVSIALYLMTVSKTE